MTFTRWSCLACVLILCCGSLVSAQDGTGRIEGFVTKDDDGVSKGVGAVLVLINELKLTEVTNEIGGFVFDALPAGTYTLILTLGENTLTRQVILLEGTTAKLDVEVDWEVGITEKVTVTAVERAAKIVDAPAAVTSVQAEEIEQQASQGQVPKVLEFTPGAEVTQSGLYDFNFNTRGFNSSLNRRVSTYIDGRDVGVVLLGAQEWAAISGGMDDIAQLSFIRGPSAALYGANASSGVVNITTKAPSDSLGTLVRLTAGQLDTLGLDFRRADELGNGWFSKVLIGFRDSGDFSVSRNPDGPDGIPGTEDDIDEPEYSEFCDLVGETDCLPMEKTLFIEQDDQIRYGSLRFDKFLPDDSVATIEAGVSDIEGPVFQTGIGRVQIIDARRPFYRFNWSNPRWNVLAHYGTREGDQANLTAALDDDFSLITDTKRYGVEAQRNWQFPTAGVQFVFGGAYTKEDVDTLDRSIGRQTVVYQPIEAHREALFTQVDWRANRYLTLVFAGRVDESTLHEPQFSPKAALVYRITPKQSLRFTYNEAFQVANYSEFFLHTRIAQFPIGGFVRTICEGPLLPQPVDCGIDEDLVPILAVGNDDLDLEKTKAWEVGYSGLIANKALITVDYYNAKNEGFITDLTPQVGTVLGDTEGCVDRFGQPETDPRQCPINNDYQEWVSTDEAENTILAGNLTVAQALRNSVNQSVGGNTLGFRLAQDLDGSTVVVGRTYANVGEVDTQGIDFGLQYFLTRAWNLQASYSWFDFEIIDADRFEDDECRLPPADRPSGCLEDILLPNTPTHKASLSISYAKKRWAGALSGRWVQEFRWSAGVFQGDVPAYYTVDLAAGYRITENIRVGVNVANLLDNVHRQTFGGDLLSRRALVNVSFGW